jgi:hypothetical protein
MLDSSADFEVWNEAATPKANGNAEAYPARVFSPAGRAKGTLTLDFTAADFQAALAQVSGGAPDTKLPNHLWMKGTLWSTTTGFI